MGCQEELTPSEQRSVLTDSGETGAGGRQKSRNWEAITQGPEKSRERTRPHAWMGRESKSEEGK